MDYRKIIGFGNSSFVISLPKKWLKSNNLHKGDTLYLDVNGKEIILYPNEMSAEKEVQEVTIEVDGLPLEVIERKIVASYINNADVMILTGEEIGERAKDIKRLIHKMVAMETIDQTANKIIAKSFLNMEEIDIENLIRKSENMIMTMFNDLDLVSKLNQKDAEEISMTISERDEDVNKLCFLIFRALNDVRNRTKRGLQGDILQIWGLGFFLEELADEIKRVARILVQIDKNELKKYLELLKEAKDTYIKSMKGYHTQNKTLVYEVAKKRSVLLQKCRDLLDKTTDQAMTNLVEQTKDMIAKIHNINKMSY